MPMKVIVACCVNCVNIVGDLKVTLMEGRNNRRRLIINGLQRTVSNGSIMFECYFHVKPG
jgi:hypothetical protein